MEDGQISATCALKRCGKAAVQCLLDQTCRGAAECAPKAVLACSRPAFDCIFGKDPVCKDNLKCLGHGVINCMDPTVNLATDMRLSNFITCAGSKCPHPA